MGVFADNEPQVLSINCRLLIFVFCSRGIRGGIKTNLTCSAVQQNVNNYACRGNTLTRRHTSLRRGWKWGESSPSGKDGVPRMWELIWAFLFFIPNSGIDFGHIAQFQLLLIWWIFGVSAAAPCWSKCASLGGKGSCLEVRNDYSGFFVWFLQIRWVWVGFFCCCSSNNLLWLKHPFLCAVVPAAPCPSL